MKSIKSSGVSPQAGGYEILSPGSVLRPQMCCSISLLLTCLTHPMGWMTLSSNTGRIHQSILCSALKITSAEGKKKRQCLKWKFPHCIFSPFKKVHSNVPSKVVVLQHQGKSSYNGEVGARNLLLEEQICSGKDTNANGKSIHLP